MIESLLRKLPFKPGRQAGSYKRLKLIEAVFRRPSVAFDSYLIYYPTNSFVPPHVDKVEGGKHYRFNFILKNAEMGGGFFCQKPILDFWRIKIFRPDEQSHSVTRIVHGYRLVFSIGFARFAKNVAA